MPEIHEVDRPTLVIPTEDSVIYADPAVLLDPEAFDRTSLSESQELIAEAAERRERARADADNRIDRFLRDN